MAANLGDKVGGAVADLARSSACGRQWRATPMVAKGARETREEGGKGRASKRRARGAAIVVCGRSGVDEEVEAEEMDREARRWRPVRTVEVTRRDAGE